MTWWGSCSSNKICLLWTLFVYLFILNFSLLLTFSLSSNNLDFFLVISINIAFLFFRRQSHYPRGSNCGMPSIFRCVIAQNTLHEKHFWGKQTSDYLFASDNMLAQRESSVDKVYICFPFYIKLCRNINSSRDILARRTQSVPVSQIGFSLP